MSFFTHEFEAPIEKFGVGKTKKIWYNVLFLPSDISATLPFDQYPRLRVDGEIADVPVNSAFIPVGDGRYYVIVGKDVLKQGDVRLGHIVSMRFGIADQDAVDVPDALAAALRNDQHAADAWAEITAGKKRMMAQHVKTAKTDPTRTKRVAEAIEAMLSHKGDLRAWRNAKR
ncbi:MAG: YdeI/OmpD-associated family protein [Parvularculaceae bacterium]|nr:YdeI/OmpD-associated family protein [Parvularculaceae bacterium]